MSPALWKGDRHKTHRHHQSIVVLKHRRQDTEKGEECSLLTSDSYLQGPRVCHWGGFFLFHSSPWPHLWQAMEIMLSRGPHRPCWLFSTKGTLGASVLLCKLNGHEWFSRIGFGFLWHTILFKQISCIWLQSIFTGIFFFLDHWTHYFLLFRASTCKYHCKWELSLKWAEIHFPALISEKNWCK